MHEDNIRFDLHIIDWTTFSNKVNKSKSISQHAMANYHALTDGKLKLNKTLGSEEITSVSKPVVEQRAL